MSEAGTSMIAIDFASSQLYKQIAIHIIIRVQLTVNRKNKYLTFQLLRLVADRKYKKSEVKMLLLILIEWFLSGLCVSLTGG